MWRESIRENEFLIYWLVCSDEAISLLVMRPTSFDARWWGVDGWMSCKPCLIIKDLLLNVETLRNEHAFAFPSLGFWGMRCHFLLDAT